MNTGRLHRLLVLSLVPVLVLAAAWPVFADKPSVTVDKLIDDQTTFEECGGLSIIRTLNGTIRTTAYFDHDGNLVRVIVHSHLRGSFTNQANGVSLPFVVASTDKIDINPDNSAIVATTGLVGRITVPGQGLVTADVGRIVLFFTGPDDPNPTLLFDSGRHDNGPFPYLCSFLGQ